MRVLLVEDDTNLSRIITRGLFERGHAVKAVETGSEAVQSAVTGRFDVAILDWELPDLDGIGVLRAWRSAGVGMPVIMLTGRGEVDDKVTGLRAGADDYLAKPFEFEELLARLEALFRRGALEGPVQLGQVIIDPRKRTVTAGIGVEKLTERESALLLELARNAGEPLTRSQLVDKVWRGEPVNPNVVDVYIGYLRTKLDRLPNPGIAITSVRKVGFRLDIGMPT
ncbi:MAG: response regulator transcription factor [Deltaproteobacteria bacterium]